MPSGANSSRTKNCLMQIQIKTVLPMTVFTLAGCHIDLGLSSGDDTWGQRLKYGVYEDVVATDLCSITFPTTVDTTKLYTVNHDDASQTQQLYVIISGGDPTGVFEQKNADDNAEYDTFYKMREKNKFSEYFFRLIV